MHRSLICKCGWVHFGVSAEYAKQAVAQFNEYFVGLSPEERLANYGNRPCSITEYSRCDRCGAPHTDSRDATAEELEPLRGSTIGALIVPEDSL